VADGLATDDVFDTIMCQIITVELEIVKTGERIFSLLVFFVFDLHCQCKQLQTSPAAAMGPKCVHTSPARCNQVLFHYVTPALIIGTLPCIFFMKREAKQMQLCLQTLVTQLTLQHFYIVNGMIGRAYKKYLLEQFPNVHSLVTYKAPV